MNRRLRNGLAAGIAAVIATVTLTAFAGETENDALKLPATKLTLASAVTIAEQSIAGRAVKAELESTKEGLAYDVEVVAQGVVHDVAVDAQTGKVLRSEVDASDDDDHDETD
jgi:uncharacterized membrane protein YkoI